jgi:hypothetical protein
LVIKGTGWVLGPLLCIAFGLVFQTKQSPATYFSFLEEGNRDDNDIDGMDFVLFIPALKLKIVI